MSWICGTQWEYCATAKKPHRCVTTAYKAKDHDHTCQYCGASKKNT